MPVLFGEPMGYLMEQLQFAKEVHEPCRGEHSVLRLCQELSAEARPSPSSSNEYHRRFLNIAGTVPTTSSISALEDAEQHPAPGNVPLTRSRITMLLMPNRVLGCRQVKLRSINASISLTADSTTKYIWNRPLLPGLWLVPCPGTLISPW